MNWQKVADNLRETGLDASQKAEAINARMPPTRVPGKDRIVDDRAATIERHRINANFCYALAEALEAGIE